MVLAKVKSAVWLKPKPALFTTSVMIEPDWSSSRKPADTVVRPL